MILFLDTANLNELRQVSNLNLVDGLTTNPSFLAKEHTDFEPWLKEVMNLISGPISIEVVSTTMEGMLKEGKKLAGQNSRIVVKLPCTKTGLAVTKILSSENIAVNATLCFSVNQAILAAKAGAKYISPFVGRLEDIAPGSGIKLIENIRIIYNHYHIKTKILSASIRSISMVEKMAILGSDIVTISPSIFREMQENPLTNSGLKKFLSDWEKFKNNHS